MVKVGVTVVACIATRFDPIVRLETQRELFSLVDN